MDRPLTIAYGAPFPPKSITVVELLLEIRNEGNKTAKGIQVLVAEPSLLAISNDFVGSSSETVLPENPKVDRHFFKDRTFSCVSFLLPNLNPGQGL